MVSMRYLVWVDMQRRKVRIKQQLCRVDADWRLTFAFAAQNPLRVHQTPEIRTYTIRTERSAIRIRTGTALCCQTV